MAIFVCFASAGWLYFRFTLSFCDLEQLLAQRAIDVSYKTVGCWAIKFTNRTQFEATSTVAGCALPLDEMVANI